MSQIFKTKKDPHAKVSLTFKFAKGLGVGETLLSGQASVMISLLEGADPTPGAIANGVSGQVGADVWVVPVQGGVSGCSYAVEVIWPTSNPNKVLTLTGVLIVVEGA